MNINSGKPYLNLKLNKVLKHYKAEKFIGEFQIRASNGCWSDQPVSVFYVKKPDTSLGHQHYIYLFQDHLGMLNIGSLTPEKVLDVQFQKGITCICGQVSYSKYRHDYVECPCGKSAVDGGRDYLKIVGEAIPVTIDLINKRLV